MTGLQKWVGDRAFYRRLFAVMIPILIQNGITNFVDMLDNVMVGRVGDVEMAGVTVANQLLFVFNLCIFGAVSGAGIFGAQFAGTEDHKGVRNAFRFKIVTVSVLTILGVLVFLFFGQPLISLYLKGEGDPANAVASLSFGWQHMLVMLIGLFPFALSQSYSGTLRETGNTVPPMIAGLIAVGINLVLNYLLIFVCRLSVVGAAIATVISRFAELGIMVVWTNRHAAANPFIIGAFRSLRIPRTLAKNILAKTLPLMLNETMWAGGMAVMNQCYSVRGLHVVNANSICQTFFQVFSVAFMAVGVSIGILVGQRLGAGEVKRAQEEANKLIAFSILISLVMGALFAVGAAFIPMIYKTDDATRHLATQLMQVGALIMPFEAFVNGAYFTLRSGGKTFITFLFDSGFVWSICVPVAFLLSRFTAIPILPLYALCQGMNLIKCGIGFFFLKQGKWLVNIVNRHKEPSV